MENPNGAKRSRRDSTKLTQFIGRGGVSLKGLNQISQTLSADSEAADAFAHAHHGSLEEANNRSFLEIRCLEELELVDGGHFTWELCEPGLLLAMMIAASPRLQDIYSKLANARAIDMDNPLSLILAFDEFTPGNKRT